MGRRSQNRSLERIARHLEALPFELIDPVLKDVPFFRALDLLCAPYTGPRLREAIRCHSRWKRILDDETDDIQYLWTSLNQISLVLYRRPWEKVDVYRFGRGKFGDIARPGEQTSKRYIIRNFESELYDSFINLLGIEEISDPYCDPSWVVQPGLLVVFNYLPVDSELVRWGNSSAGSEESEPLAILAARLSKGIRGSDRGLNIPKIILEFKRAYSRLFEEQSAELRALADLYERFPRFLKVSGAPEVPTSEAHILAQLRNDAARRRGIPGWNRKEEHTISSQGRTWYRFRYPHPTLVPFEWCLRLFKVAIERSDVLKIEEKLPSNLRAHFKNAQDGVDYIYGETPDKRLRRTCGDTAETAGFAQYPFSAGVSPKPAAEIAWLESFITIIEWMAKEFPDITQSVASDQLSILRRRLLVDPSDYRLFVEHEPPRNIARQLRVDLEVCRAGSPSKLPSLLALYMPSWPSPRAVEIAKLLAPHRDCHRDLLELLYESKISEICRILKGTPEPRVAADGSFIVADEIARDVTKSATEKIHRDSISDTQNRQQLLGVYDQDLVTTANTLQRLFKEMTVSTNATGSEILAHLLTQVEDSISKQDAQNNAPWQETVQNYVASQSRHTAQRDCYICGRRLTTHHPTISSMCLPCGNFNLAGSQLSLPPRMSLAGKVAAVTGARVNLGYRVTLRLLRCGARVIASTRYPHDALQRYKAEKDAEEWMDRLRIVGADFRSARDAFELAREIRRIVQEWGATLHILINNAAQTLTDSIEKERFSVGNEERLKGSIGQSLLLPSTSYTPKVRGGNVARIEGLAPQQLTADPTTEPAALGSSWVQSLGNIPYEDVISAHSVNAFVPLILVRELLPIMSADKPPGTPSSHACGYIVNVSSREGIFEQVLGGPQSAKNGRHVHTNMSKAALNMITETEAAEAWRMARVAMNTVDPGYMSAAPELEAVNGVEMPIGWEDGAGRVLWPIAVGELEKTGEVGCRAVWGRFLKHYGAARVNLQQGLR
ncbi:NAD(P)-binding protein [Nemania sp. FL0031]|nr:NAD(P)-binding protein [Nemania sp. FL0031]